MEILEERGRTIYWLSKQLGVDFTALYRLRDGKARGIRFELLAGMCQALECQISDLLILDENKPAAKKTPHSRTKKER
ncbi:MAG TPA: helix-turn-helix transcriptional regulator [Blastocatellia bacterium]